MRAKAKQLNSGKSESLRQRAYEEIKSRIVTLKYAPGEYLNGALVSAQLDIGRTPVQQALDRLMREGMLEVIPRKGVIVKPVSLDEVLQLIEARLVNETHCAAFAAQRATAQEVHDMRAILDRAHSLIKAHDLEGLMNLDREFHSSISRAAKNRVMAEILLSLHERSLRFWFISLSHREHMLQVQAEHERVFEAIKSRDSEAARQAIRAHIESFRQTITTAI